MHVSDFRIAGSVSDQEGLAQVVRIAGYTANLHRMVSDHFAECPVHARAGARRARRAAPTQSCARGCLPAIPGPFVY